MKAEYDLSKNKRGRVNPLGPDKVRITIRLDRDLIEHFRDKVREAGRGNYQTLINDALREQIQRPDLAETVTREVRAALRQELKKLRVSA